MTRPLSPAARAMMDAFLANWEDEPRQQDRRCLAAAIRALADQAGSAKHWHVNQLLELADELEGQADG